MHEKKAKTLGQIMVQQNKGALLQDNTVTVQLFGQTKPFDSPSSWRFTSRIHLDDNLMKIHGLLKGLLPYKKERYQKTKENFVMSEGVKKWTGKIIAPGKKDGAVTDFTRGTTFENKLYYNDPKGAEQKVKELAGIDTAKSDDDKAKAKAVEQFIRDVGGQDMMVLQDEFATLLDRAGMLPGVTGAFSINWLKDNDTLYCEVKMNISMPSNFEGVFYKLGSDKRLEIIKDDLATHQKLAKSGELPPVAEATAKIRLDTIKGGKEYKVIPRVTNMTLTQYTKDLNLKTQKGLSNEKVEESEDQNEKPGPKFS